MASPPPKILAILPGFTASTLMDVVQPMMSLGAVGQIKFRVALEQYFPPGVVRWADVVVFCRNTEPKYRIFLDAVCAHNIPTIYDLDDNLFEIPEDSKLGLFHRDPRRIQLLTQYIQSASLVRVYSKPLFERAKSLTSRVELVTTPLNWDLIEAPDLELNYNGPVKIVYVTSRADDRLFSVFSQALVRILHDFPDQVVMYFWGAIPQEFQNLDNVVNLPFISNYKTFMRQFSRHGFDIGLAPLLDDIFHRSKTNNKFREYGACGIAGIYSDVDVYTDFVQNEQTGLVVSNDPQAWYEALRKLVLNAPLRHQISQNAHTRIRELYPQNSFQTVWLTQIKTVLSESDSVQSNDGRFRKNLNPAGPHFTSKVTAGLRRVIEIWRSGGVGELMLTLRLQINNFWLLFKINILRKL